ncbi:MAG: inositol monophosphatase [Verrucomicrobiota bacterium]
MDFSEAESARARRLLCALQDHIQATMIAARLRAERAGARATEGLAAVAAITAADTIYAIDRVSEAAILEWFGRHWPKSWPVELVMEGLEGAAVTFPAGTPVVATRWKCILDPIDGTRGIMYDKRPAWSLAGLAAQRGSRTGLGDIVVAAMTELPVSKQTLADQFSAVRGGGLVATRRDLSTGRSRRWTPRPSQARDFDHGFASIVKFFPEGKVWLAELEEALWRELGLWGRNGGQLVFEEQYISTGGQLNELLAGHDRMVLDLRPLAFASLGLPNALCAHPYDLCSALLLTEAGGVVADPRGGALRAPLDTTTSVAWAGYANPALARRVGPVLRRLLRERAG